MSIQTRWKVVDMVLSIVELTTYILRLLVCVDAVAFLTEIIFTCLSTIR